MMSALGVGADLGEEFATSMPRVQGSVPGDATSSFRGTLVTHEPHCSADRLRDARCVYSECCVSRRRGCKPSDPSTHTLELGAWLPTDTPSRAPPTLPTTGERPNVTRNGAFSWRHPEGHAGTSGECPTRAHPHSRHTASGGSAKKFLVGGRAACT